MRGEKRVKRNTVPFVVDTSKSNDYKSRQCTYSQSSDRVGKQCSVCVGNPTIVGEGGGDGGKCPPFLGGSSKEPLPGTYFNKALLK